MQITFKRSRPKELSGFVLCRAVFFDLLEIDNFEVVPDSRTPVEASRS